MRKPGEQDLVPWSTRAAKITKNLEFGKIHKALRKPIQAHENMKCYETNSMKIRALMNKTEQDVGS